MSSTMSIAGIFILLLIGLVFFAIVAGGIALIFSLSRRSKPDSAAETNAYLSAENQRLREEIARLKKELARDG